MREDGEGRDYVAEDCGGKRNAERQDAEEENPLVDVTEAARMCKVSVSMFYKMIRAGRVPEPIKFGRLMRWRRREFAKWIGDGCPPQAKTK